MTKMEYEAPDLPLGLGSGAGVIFGTTGGVAEAVARYVLPDKSQNTLRKLKFSPLREDDSIREVTLNVDQQEIRIAIVHGLVNAKKLLKEIEEGGQQIVRIVEKPADDVISFDTISNNDVIDKLRGIDINTTTPIEAMGLLFELKKMID